MNSLLERLKWLPILGNLIDCERVDFYEALKEVFAGLVVSMSPFWLYIVLSLISVDAPTIQGILKDLLSTGILVIYAATLLAPIIYTVFSDKEKPFPNGMSIMLTSLVIWLISAGVYALSDPRIGSKVDFEPAKMPAFSIAMFSIAVFLLYVTSVYKNRRMRPADIMSDDTRSYVDAFTMEN